MKVKTIDVYTDGSCSRNPGVGGYAAIMQCGGKERKLSGYTTNITTNNQMELKAVLEAVKWLNEHQNIQCRVIIYTDSQYVIDCAQAKNTDGTNRTVEWFRERKNGDMWIELIKARKRGGHILSFVKVKGHSGNELNERCNTLAQSACKIAKEEIKSGRVHHT